MSATNNDMEFIAIIGMAGRFPGAKNISEFWHNLCNGVESISQFSDEELIAAGIPSELINHPNYVKAGASLENVDLFDASFFGFNPKEAEITDPQHRLFLEYAWEALEDAGYDTQRTESRIGVYAGASISNYLSFDFNHDQIGSANSFQKLLGNDKDFLATRVSYKLNLTGPSLSVQTACSTSLVATSLACQSLLNYQCDMALAGGVSIRVPQKTGYLHQEGGILSPDGHCRAFDIKAQGTIIGNGVGVVVLKRLSDAVVDGDNIYAVIRGTAINNDGSSKVGYTAPSVDGQAQAITEALLLASVEPETIGYVEAHGTGTALGDPIEISALTNAFHNTTQKNNQKNNYCAIGSVKTNIGHLDAAAGIVGLIKTALAIKHKLIPPSLNFSQPNAEIDFANSPFYVNTKLMEWQDATPRRAGVSSLGIGGTNAHVILEEAPVGKPDLQSNRDYQLLLLSAKTESALLGATQNLANHLRQYPNLELNDVAYTLQVGRREFNHRRMVVCNNITNAISFLESNEPERVLTDKSEFTHHPITFMFPGQGSQYVNMASSLYETEPAFRLEVDKCCLTLQPYLGLDLRSIIYPSEDNKEAATAQVGQTSLTQPALFVIEYALAKLWMSWGILPQAMIGHSIGEYVAASLASVISIEDALTLVAFRAQLMQQMPPGAMLSVALPEVEVKALLNENLCLAASNASNLCVVAGNFEAITIFEEKLAVLGVDYRRLHTSHAFHSQMMEPVLEPFIEKVKSIKLNSPQIPYISNLTGTWITAEQATDANYWAQHLRQTVQFSAGILTLLQEPNHILLEVGTGRTLCSLVKQHSQLSTQQLVLRSLPHPQEQKADAACLLHSLGELWLAGVKINWSGFYQYQKPRRVSLPTYPFERQRYWIETQTKKRDISKLDINDWFYVPSWKRSMSPLFLNYNVVEQKQCWLVFIDDCGIGAEIVELLKKQNQEVIIVRIAEKFAKYNQYEYAINPENRDEYEILLKELRHYNQLPQHIAHFWNITPHQYSYSGLTSWEEIQGRSFWSLLFLAQALGEQNSTNPIRIDVISNQLQCITDSDHICPAKATLLGICKVIPQEYPNFSCRSIDITLNQSIQQVSEHLFAELINQSPDLVVAYRDNQRWVQYFEKLPVKNLTQNTPKLRQEGVYIITGGLGGIGLEIAQYLAKTVKARLVLVGRSGFGKEDPTSDKMQKVQKLEEYGASVLVIQADVGDYQQMQAMVNQVCQHFGTIHGVIHAAGVPGAGLMQFKSPEMAKNVLLPKVKGTLVLDDVLQVQDINLDFLVLFSSVTSICGGLGQVDYCAANAFLDAFAHYNFYNRNKLTFAINWDAWEWDNWQNELLTLAPEIQAEFQFMRAQYGIKFVEGVNAFEKILSWQIPQVVVVTRRLQDIITQYNNFRLSNVLTRLESSGKLSYEESEFSPRNPIECKIAKCYQDVLGVAAVGIYDDFFDLGGNSLIATQLIFQLRQELQVDLSVKSLFTAPTVAGLALVVENQMIEELDKLTDEEAEALLLGVS